MVLRRSNETALLCSFLCILFLLNRRVLLDELSQNSKRKHRRPATHREIKDGKRKIKFDKVFAQRVLHAGYQHFEPFSSLGRKDVEFLFVKTARVEISVLGNLRNILYLKSRKDAENIKQASSTRGS